jgi:hypothetical protein
LNWQLTEKLKKVLYTHVGMLIAKSEGEIQVVGPQHNRIACKYDNEYFHIEN